MVRPFVTNSIRNFWTTISGISPFPGGTNRLKITLPFDLFSRSQSSAEESGWKFALADRAYQFGKW